MKCPECYKRLTPNEIGYGHDCEVSPSPMVEYYNYEANNCSCTTNYMCRSCVGSYN